MVNVRILNCEVTYNRVDCTFEKFECCFLFLFIFLSVTVWSFFICVCDVMLCYEIVCQFQLDQSSIVLRPNKSRIRVKLHQLINVFLMSLETLKKYSTLIKFLFLPWNLQLPIGKSTFFEAGRQIDWHFRIFTNILSNNILNQPSMIIASLPKILAVDPKLQVFFAKLELQKVAEGYSAEDIVEDCVNVNGPTSNTTRCWCNLKTVKF